MLDKVLLLLRTYCEITGQRYVHIRFFDDHSGGLYTYDDVEIAEFGNVPEAHEMLTQLIIEAAK